MDSELNLPVFQNLLNSIATGIVILGNNHRIIDANNAIARISGFKDSNAFIKAFRDGKMINLFKFVDANGAELSLEEIQTRILGDNRIKKPLIVGINRKGIKKTKYLQLSTQYFQVVDNTEPYIVLTLLEITDLIVTQQTSLNNDRLLTLALNSSKGVAWDYNRQSETVTFSEQIHTILGNKNFNLTCPLPEFVGIIHPADRKWVTEAVVDVINGIKNELFAEYRLIRKNGSICYVLTKGLITARDNKDNPAHLSGVFVDISSYKKIESKLEKINRTLNNRIKNEIKKQRSQQIVLLQKSRLESLGELAAGIVHEINQPLGILSLQLDLLKDYVSGNALEKNQCIQKIDDLFENIVKINGIIDHIRTFAHHEKLSVPEDFDINTVLRKITKMVQPQFNNTNIQIKLVLTEGLGQVNGSKQQFEQVILNLLSNARYALDEKSQSGLHKDFKKEINIETFEDTDKVVLNFTDNGTGIPQKLIRKLFDPFYTSKPADKGTGLGLPICYKIISGMNGNIQFESQKGEYTRVLISIPKTDTI